MTDQPENQSSQSAPPDPEALPATPGSPSSDGKRQQLADRASSLADERPELVIGAALAGGFLFAQILKRLAP